MTFLHFVATLFDWPLLQDLCWIWSGLWIKRWTLIITFNPIKPVFLSYNTWGGEGQVCPQAFSFSPELQERVTCSKMGSHSSFCKNLQFKTHLWCLVHLVPEIQLFEEKKAFFLTFQRSEATLAPFVRVPPLGWILNRVKNSNDKNWLMRGFWENRLFLRPKLLSIDLE